MSVAQVKKRFGEMESYLGRDKEALRRLKLLKDDVNVLRTSLAAAEEKAEQAEIVKNAARDRADVAEQKLSDAEIEIHRLKQQVVSLMADLEKATKPEEKTIGKDDPEYLIEVGDHVECKRMLKRLRRHLPQCPRLQHLKRHPVFFRHEFAEGWSHQSIWTLGASVAILAAHEGSVTIHDPIGVVFEKEGDERSDGLAFNFLRWYGKNIDFSECGRTRCFNERVRTKPLRNDAANDADMTAEFLSGGK